MTAAPYALRRVILHAARSKEYPAGSIRRGYDLIAPLTPEGRIDRDGWKTHRGECFAHRFWDDEPAQRGLLVHRAGGRGGSTWGLELGAGARLDEEDMGFRFGDHVFRPGEYVSGLGAGRGTRDVQGRERRLGPYAADDDRATGRQANPVLVEPRHKGADQRVVLVVNCPLDARQRIDARERCR
jgi:hypothetical protein